MTLRFLDKQGNPLTIDEYETLFSREDYKILKQTHVNGRYFVSTVWLGINHAYGDGPPMIFETMVFHSCKNEQITDLGELDMERYATEKEALEGHENMCKRFAELCP